MLKKQFLAGAILLAASVPTSSWSQEAWQLNATCSVTAPAVEGKPNLTIVATIKTDAKSVETSSVQIRIQTDDVVLKDDEKAENVIVSVPQESDFSGLTATGSVGRRTNLIVVAIPTEAKILPAFSRGSSAIVKIPTATGEKQLDVDLKGSGAAIKQLVSRCG